MADLGNICSALPEYLAIPMAKRCLENIDVLAL